MLLEITVHQDAQIPHRVAIVRAMQRVRESEAKSKLYMTGHRPRRAGSFSRPGPR
jgi:hypothetical protein